MQVEKKFMKNLYLSIVLSFFSFSTVFGQSSLYNLSFDNATENGSNFCIEVYISFDAAGDKLGSTNLVFDFDNSVINTPLLQSHTLTLLPFPVYEIPSITTPTDTRASFNIELNVAGFGDPIAAAPGRTLLGQICFDYPVSGQTVNLNWYVSGTSGTVNYLDDESTQLSPGTLDNYSGVPSTFPVEWLGFDAKLYNEDAVIDWNTGAELNNSHFEIERSKDGNVFEKVGEVQGHGNATTTQSYQFTDPKVTELGVPTLYYRLRQVDLDGAYTYSTVVKLSLTDVSFLLVEGNPNPFSNELLVSYTNGSEKPFTLKVVNGIGQKLWTENQQDRIGKIRVNTESWPQGIYFLSAENEGQRLVYKILKY